MDTQTDRHRQTCRQTDTQTDRQTDTQIDRQTDRQRDRQSLVISSEAMFVLVNSVKDNVQFNVVMFPLRALIYTFMHFASKSEVFKAMNQFP